MNKLRLPKLISDGMILQQKKNCHIWGYDVAGRQISIDFDGNTYSAVADLDGCFEVWLEAHESGGPYEMIVRDDADNKLVVHDVYYGEVFLCSGQSNMELTMYDVLDMFPEEISDCDYPQIRTFKIEECLEFGNPLVDTNSGEWKKPNSDNIASFSALGYFFAKELYKLTGIPVGFIDSSLGGAKISCFMSREMLEGYSEELKIAEKYSNDEFRNEVLRKNDENTEKWHKELDKKDVGLLNGFIKEDYDASNWKKVILPGFFKDTEIGNYVGCVYFRKDFCIDKENAGKSAKLWLGTIVDSDETYINGEFVGTTDYQYPSRKYLIREGLLHEGVNNITVRVKCESTLVYDKNMSAGRFTPDKKYAIFYDNYEIDLSGEWRFEYGCEMLPAPTVDFVKWKPTCLYYGMTAPCHKYTIGGINWYQGESDCEENEKYHDLFHTMIKAYRKEWKDKKLWVSVVQLPNFEIDNEPGNKSWYRMREALRRCSADLEYSESVVSFDLGEDNDLHPQNKKELGRRLALVAAKECLNMDVQALGPVISNVFVTYENDECAINLEMDEVGEGLQVLPANGKGEKDGRVLDFIIRDEDANDYECDVKIFSDKIILRCSGLKRDAAEIRYCYANTNKGPLVYNSNGLPLSPGIYTVI